MTHIISTETATASGVKGVGKGGYMARMSWTELLNTVRLSETQQPTRKDPRHPFEQDLDRIVFSEAFRRLQHKTQVHPLPTNDHVHNRMSHSLETASIARSLGTLLGKWLSEKGELPDDAEVTHLSNLAKAATLAHDIGNVPFGHAGEQAIQEWFRGDGARYRDRVVLNELELTDLKHFDGNPQGFRILTALESDRRPGGLRLTHAVLSSVRQVPFLIAMDRK